MPARLDPAERERRRKERARNSFSDAAYKHRSADAPRGSPEDWVRAAGGRMNGEAPITASKVVDADLSILGLEAMPEMLRDLTRAFRRASMAAHPDQGGSDEAFIAVRTAYDRLKTKFD